MERRPVGQKELQAAAEEVRVHRHQMAAAPSPDACNLKSGLVGLENKAFVGMRVRHVQGRAHGFSHGLLGTVELIPGRSRPSRLMCMMLLLNVFICCTLSVEAKNCPHLTGVRWMRRRRRSACDGTQRPPPYVDHITLARKAETAWRCMILYLTIPRNPHKLPAVQGLPQVVVHRKNRPEKNDFSTLYQCRPLWKTEDMTIDEIATTCSRRKARWKTNSFRIFAILLFLPKARGN